jgi:hypothetical protein
MNNKRPAVIVREIKDTKLVSWAKSILAKFKLHKDSRAGIIVDKNGIPQLFIFDTPAFLDVLGTVDEALVDRLSDEEYHSKTANPAGWLIDEIEAKLPPNPQFVQSLKDALEEARRKGWVSFSKIQKSLGLK